ncbi:MAG: hypothetical protein JWQ25_500 [Daejeonella sp.]|nr:hypothetical protein [Daejeonella sp.]
METINSSVLQALIITKNEDPNIERVLSKLRWLEKVVVLDSYSTDATLEIVKSFTNVTIHYRAFDTFATQCNYGLSLINSKWIISLDADYVLTDEFIEETKQLVIENNPNQTAYCSKFKFLIYGRQLISNNTTARPVLFRNYSCLYVDDGHAHRLEINGNVGSFKACILHDDRKSLSRWLSNQDGYSIRECAKLLDDSNENSKSVINKIRRTKVFAPIIVFFYSLFFKGLIFNGWAGWYYTLQRTMVEMLWALRMIEHEKLNINQTKDQHSG